MNEIAVVLRNFNRDVFRSHHRLAGQARKRRAAERIIELIVFVIVRFIQGIETFLDNHVAGGAGAVVFARMRNLDACSIQSLSQLSAGLDFNLSAPVLTSI